MSALQFAISLLVEHVSEGVFVINSSMSGVNVVFSYGFGFILDVLCSEFQDCGAG